MLLEKIVEYCGRISENLERFENSFAAFQTDHLFQDACCMCIIQIGKLAGRLSDELKAAHSSIPWRIIKDTRNFYVHAYGSADIPSVWETLQTDIPQLKAACEAMLNK